MLYQNCRQTALFAFVFLFLVNISACQTSLTTTVNDSTIVSNDSIDTPPIDKGEMEFEEYLDLKRTKFKGQLAPNVVIRSIDGKTYNLRELKDKIVLLNFWFAACKPCITEIPSLNELHDQFHSKNVIILSLSTDNMDIAKKMATEKKMRYTVSADGKKLAEMLEVSSFPTSFLINEKGIIQEVFIGANDFDATQTYREVKPYLEKMIDE